MMWKTNHCIFQMLTTAANLVGNMIDVWKFANILVKKKIFEVFLHENNNLEPLTGVFTVRTKTKVNISDLDHNIDIHPV